MTGFRSSALRHNCPVHGCFIDSLPLWDDIAGCFSGGARPTDIDAMVEIGGQFLFIEQKRAGVYLPDGQRKALQRLADVGAGRITVTVLRDVTDNPDAFDVLTFPEPRGFERMQRSVVLDGFRLWDADARGAS